MRAVGLGKHVAVVAALAGGHALFELAAVAAQLGDGSEVEVDVAAAGGGLGVALDEQVRICAGWAGDRIAETPSC